MSHNIQTTTKYLNQLEEYILIALAGQERYGLEIIEILQKNSNSKISPSIGTLYPTLQRLEQEGCITSRLETASGESRARRKYFKVTQNGLRHLANMDLLRSNLYAHQA